MTTAETASEIPSIPKEKLQKLFSLLRHGIEYSKTGTREKQLIYKAQKPKGENLKPGTFSHIILHSMDATGELRRGLFPDRTLRLFFKKEGEERPKSGNQFYYTDSLEPFYTEEIHFDSLTEEEIDQIISILETNISDIARNTFDELRYQTNLQIKSIPPVEAN